MMVTVIMMLMMILMMIMIFTKMLAEKRMPTDNDDNNYDNAVGASITMMTMTKMMFVIRPDLSSISIIVMLSSLDSQAGKA